MRTISNNFTAIGNMRNNGEVITQSYSFGEYNSGYISEGPEDAYFVKEDTEYTKPGSIIFFNDFEVLKDAIKADRENVLVAVREYGYVLEYVDDSFRADREIVLAAVQQDGNAIEFAAEVVKNDPEIVAASKQ